MENLSQAQRKRLEIGMVVVAWEKRRVYYNGVLAAVSALPVAFFLVSSEVTLDHLAMLVIACIGANACYCAGPIVEGYWTWVLGPAPWMRNLFFALGTAASCLVALACVAGVFYPTF